MNKYCEVKLVDIVTPDKAKNRSKLRDFNSSYLLPKNNLNKAVKRKIKTGNVSSRNDSCQFIENDAQTVSYNSEDSTRSSSGVSKNSHPKKHLSQTSVMGFEQTDSLVSLQNCSRNRNRFETVEKRETKTQKRKYAHEDKKDILPLSKKPCNVQNVVSISCNTTKNSKIESIDKKATEKKDGNQEKMKRQKKKKGSKILWENKLTGAKRVSKRLTNLRIKNKTLDKLQSCFNTDNTILRKKKLDSSVNSVDKRVKRMKICHDNHTKHQTSNSVRKTTLIASSQKNLPDHHKKSYTKIPSNRKISTSYRVKVKPPSCSLSNISHTRRPMNIFIEYSEPEHESVNSTSSEDEETNTTTIIAENVKYVNEDIQKVDVETSQDPEVEFGESKVLDNHSNTDVQCQVNEPQNVEIVESVKEDALNTIVYDIEERCIDSSEVIIVDIESGKSVLYGHEENCQPINTSTKDNCQTHEEKNTIFEEVSLVTPRKSSNEDSDNMVISSKEKDDLLIENQSQTENLVATNVIDKESDDMKTDDGGGEKGNTTNVEVIVD